MLDKVKEKLILWVAEGWLKNKLEKLVEANKMKSWKTTGLGVAMILGSVAFAATALLDNDPTTVVDFKILYASIMAGFGLIAARDNNKTSEDVGVK